MRDAPPSLPASGFGSAWFGLCVAFALHIVDEAGTGFLAVYNPTVTILHQRWEWFSHANIRFSRVAVRTDRRVRVVVLLDSGGGAGDTRIAAPGLGLRSNHVDEWPGPYLVFDLRTHRGCGDLPPSSAGFLFIAVSVGGFAVADGTAAADRAGGFSIALGRLSDAGFKHGGCCYHLLRSVSF